MPVRQYILCTAKTAQCSVRIIGTLEYTEVKYYKFFDFELCFCNMYLEQQWKFESNQINNKLDAVEIEIWIKILKLISATV